MSHIEAIYRQGVFKPLDPVDLQEEQHVRLSIETTEHESPANWLQRTQALQASIVCRHRHLPDSTPDIAADRLR